MSKELIKQLFSQLSREEQKELLNELPSAGLTPGVWNVIMYLRDDRKTMYGEPKYIHLIEKDGIETEVQLVGNIYDKNLNDRQPTCSDEDPEWDSEWEKYGEYSLNYFIGKKVKIESFKPLTISKIII